MHDGCCKSRNFQWVQTSVKIFRESFGIIINSVGLAGRKALVASVFILGDILNGVKTSFTEITKN